MSRRVEAAVDPFVFNEASNCCAARPLREGEVEVSSGGTLEATAKIWANYNDISRGHLKLWFSKGIPPQITLSHSGSLGIILICPDTIGRSPFEEEDQEFWIILVAFYM